MKGRLNIVIVGCGRVGGSLARSLYANRERLAEAMNVESMTIIGHDTHDAWQGVDVNPLKAFDTFYPITLPDEVVITADVVIVCTPIDEFPHIASQLQHQIGKHTVVIDVGSRKQQSVKAFTETSIQNYFPIHPMVGGPSINYGRDLVEQYQTYSTDFLNGRPVFYFPKTQRGDDAKALALLKALRADLVETDEEEHDRTCALTSYLPQCIASILYWYAVTTEQEITHDPTNLPFAFQAKKILDGMWLPVYLQNNDIKAWLKGFVDTLITLCPRQESSLWSSPRLTCLGPSVQALDAQQNKLYGELLPMMIVQALKDLHKGCESPIKDAATGRGFEMFTSLNCENLSELLKQCDRQSLDAVVQSFIEGVGKFSSALEERADLENYLKTSMGGFSQAEQKALAPTVML